MEYSFTRYLRAKVSVDDRALNQLVWEEMVKLLPEQSPSRPLRVLEIGCGIGTMLERMVGKGVFNQVDYTGIDLQAENTRLAEQGLQDWPTRAGFQLAEGERGINLLEDKDRHLAVRFITEDLREFLAIQPHPHTWDLLIAHAFLDLVNVPSILPALLQQLRKGGVFYLTLNFDGQTILEPPVHFDLDGHIERLYHLTMDRRLVDGEPSGDSLSGRRLFKQLVQAGGDIQASGSSDWVVYPRKDSYPGDEAYFLHHIIHTIQQALLGDRSIDGQLLQDWAAFRHAQVERNELVYIAHQIDFVGTV